MVELNGLKKKINQYKPLFRVVVTSSSFNDALTKIKKNKPDIVFLDFNIENRVDLILLKELKQKNISIILSVSHLKDALVSFDYNVLHTIERPYTEENIAVTFNKIYGRLIRNEVLFNISKK
ncbi:hypothetical protein [Flavobacterium lacisediminis]|uniref:Response regulatory domain-containing protein n=1 Tax=Flavobacterium lacisediminis TaxID=2989705 RepID=A0ABT3EJS7_9FLAO|nr:hypothetical protein [Flavobacterium lacisediminis]MCW1148836.1 hypothetical protein [Flavobacterium lacisediminis]